MPNFNYQEYLASREWALLKNMVRQRSGGTCERCHRAPYQSTHHKTYERIGHELLEDLLGLCNPCHEYLSGKTSADPIDQPERPRAPTATTVRVYLAGKIGQNDWRHSLFPGLRDLVDSEFVEDLSGGHSGGLLSLNIEKLEQDHSLTVANGMIYGGPYFVSCDHGGFHGENSHGQGGDWVNCCAREPTNRWYLAHECLDLIARADYVFCWLDTADAYGTIFELGWATAKDIPIFLATPRESWATRWIRDIWFTRTVTRALDNAFDNPKEAWETFVATTRLSVTV